MVSRKRLKRNKKKKKMTRLKRIQKKCPHHQFHYEAGKGYVCDLCGATLTGKQVKTRQLLWMLYLGPDPARGQGPTSTGYVRI